MFLFYRTPVYKATQTKQSSQISNEMRFRKNRQGNDSTCTSFVISSELCAAVDDLRNAIITVMFAKFL